MFSRFLLFAAPLLLLTALPGHAQAQGSGQNCDTAQHQQRQSTARSVIGGLSRFGLGRVGGVAAAAIPMTDMLSDALINLLDCQEQQKASAATDEAVRGGEVGS